MFKSYFSIKKFNNNKIKFGFFTSRGGVSSGNYFSLNCSKNNKDNKVNVSKNIKIALKKLGLKNQKLKLINQIHSNKIIHINKDNYNNEIYGDGLITEERNIAIGVLTADCAPIFIFDKNKSIICCLHSGWKGSLANIVKNSIKKFKQKKIISSNIFAIIGPCLAYENFEVDKKFKLKFIQKNKFYRQFFKYKNKKKDLFNLRKLINYQFKSEGVSNVFNIRKDTYKNSQYFFSHRRATHKNQPNSGRMINIISLKE